MYLKMNLNDLLLIKLKKDLIKELHDEYTTNKTLSSQVSEQRYLELITMKCESIQFTIDHKEQKIVSNKNRCCARVWMNHRGLRCSNKIKSGDYCLKHINQIKNKGYLSFKRYDEQRPLYNEKGNKIPWYDYSPIEMIDILINYQNLQLRQLTMN